MKYKIYVKALNGTLLTYSVEDYNVLNGFVVFTDQRTGQVKRYPVSNCEINEGVE